MTLDDIYALMISQYDANVLLWQGFFDALFPLVVMIFALLFLNIVWRWYTHD